MKKLLNFNKLFYYLLLAIIFASCGETEEEYWERIRMEEAEAEINNCPIFPNDFQPLFCSVFKYHRKNWGPENQNLVITISRTTPLFEDDTLGLIIDEDFNYDLILKSQIINNIDSTSILDFTDKGHFSFEEDLTHDGNSANRNYNYQFHSEVDQFSTEEINFTFSCNVMWLIYSKRLNERDSIYGQFIGLKNN